LNNIDFVGGLKAVRKIKDLATIYKDTDVAADLLLFVYHPKADAGILAVKIGEKRTQIAALRLDAG
jgi:hypothetical protein